jgi:phage terminase large subunit-like protein
VSLSLLQRAIDKVGVKGVLEALPPEQHERLRYEWAAWARPEQLPPDGQWLVWFILAGRGFGKTRTGAEWCRSEIESGRRGRLALIAPTAADARDVMVEGESGVLAISPPWFRPVYEPSKRRITWPNGAVATLYSADEPERLRGPQHDGGWADEPASWRYAEDAWDMLQFGLRLGSDPRMVVTGTPKPVKLVRELIKAKTTVVTRGSTFDNAANLAKPFLAAIKAKYDGTRLGRQELHAEVLDDVEGALWTYGMIERARVVEGPTEWMRTVTAVDPSGSAKATADEAGIVTVRTAMCACQGTPAVHAFVLEDGSGRYSPDDMGRRAVGAYHRYDADRLVAEDNFGGKIIEDLIRLIDRRVAYRAVRASRGKIVRAEPVAALYEQGRVHHVGMFEKLEDEMCTFTPTEPTSPGRMDALVWAITDLMLGEPSAGFRGQSFTSPSFTFGIADTADDDD